MLLARQWQLGTIQVDYNLPERFNLNYVDKIRTKKTSNDTQSSIWKYGKIYCNFNRAYWWKFPLWLTTNQVSLIPVGEKHKKYCEKVSELLENNEIRATTDGRNETVGKKLENQRLIKFHIC